MPRPITENTLYYGDNLPILRTHVTDSQVDLVYLDPPFNANRSFNILFRDAAGREAQSQLAVFSDTWEWSTTAEQTYHELLTGSPPHVSTMVAALHSCLGASPIMAYLVMMTARLVELHRVLKPTGSLYLHCDPVASHYLKTLLDAVFGPMNFRNEIIWQRTNAKGLASVRFARNHDVILFYTKSGDFTWHTPYTAYDPAYIERFYRHTEPETGRRYQLADLTNPNKDRPNLTYEFLGVTRVWRWTRERMLQAYERGLIYQAQPGSVPRLKRYLDEQEGMPVGDTWMDIPPIQPHSVERLGYPTQKPLALLERIIRTSSNPGDIVLDPFCGCGTAVIAAEKLDRRWIGIDISHLAIALVRSRLRESFSETQFRVLGEPEDVGAARQLAGDNRHQFEWWALSLVRARPIGSSGEDNKGKKGRDRGIDGVIVFVDEANGKPKRVLVQVKSGHVGSRDVRDLRGVVEREQAVIGVFISLEEPTREMLHEATVAGAYHSPGWNRDYPRLQILTITELLAGAEVSMPPAHHTFTPAQRIIEEGKQRALL